MHRRTFLVMPVAAALQGCSNPLAPLDHHAIASDARMVLEQAALAHGSGAWSRLSDVNVSYFGRFRPIVGTLQPNLVDAGHRAVSQERWQPQASLLAQSHTGPAGRKQVVRRLSIGGEGDVRVWFDNLPSDNRDARAAAALVADDYCLFLAAPMVLAAWLAAGRPLSLALSGVEGLTQDGQDYTCDVLRVSMAPGMGFSAQDDLALYIDQTTRLMRRIRFTLNGLSSTQGAVAEVDTMRYVSLHGVQWPTRYHERLLRPLPLPVHDWQLTGLDVNRGWTEADVAGASFVGRAMSSATPLP